MKYVSSLMLVALTLCQLSQLVEASPRKNPQVTVVVSTTRDSGQGSLRAALEIANRKAGTRIVFRIPQSTLDNISASLPTLTLLSPLPVLRQPYTQIAGQNQMIIAGSKASTQWSGLRIVASGCQISGLKWKDWPNEALVIRAKHTFVEDNTFDNVPVGIVVQGANASENRFESNLFDSVKTPIVFRSGANGGIMAPSLTIERETRTTSIPMRYTFTVRFKGRPGTHVAFELNYSEREAYQSAYVQRVEARHIVKTDNQGNAIWQFDRKGYPVGSWSVTATQSGCTSPFSNFVILPYL